MSSAHIRKQPGIYSRCIPKLHNLCSSQFSLFWFFTCSCLLFYHVLLLSIFFLLTTFLPSIPLFSLLRFSLLRSFVCSFPPSHVPSLLPFFVPSSLLLPYFAKLLVRQLISSLSFSSSPLLPSPLPFTSFDITSLSVMYFDGITNDGVSGCLLKVEALQGLDRFEEAVSECELHIAHIKGKGKCTKMRTGTATNESTKQSHHLIYFIF